MNDASRKMEELFESRENKTSPKGGKGGKGGKSNGKNKNKKKRSSIVVYKRYIPPIMEEHMQSVGKYSVQGAANGAWCKTWAVEGC